MPDDFTPCPHFGACGGCTRQDRTEADYRMQKQAELNRILAPLGVAARAMIFIPPATRRRVTLAARHRKGGPELGFNRAKSHEIVNLEACLTARSEIVAIVPALRHALAGWLRRAEGLDVTLTLFGNGLDVLVTGPAPDLDARQDMAAFATRENIARLSWRADVKSPGEPMLLRREPVLKFGQALVTPTPGAFLQPSAEGEAALVAAVRDAVGPARKIADLFAGCGTFGLRLAGPAQATLVEGDADAFASLNRAAGPLKTATALRRDLFRDPLLAKELNGFDAVVFDPPRAGAAAQSLELAKSKVPVLAAISCNPNTFMRDAKALLKGGYRCDWVQPVDQFIWSDHLELVAKFSRA